ncbi:RNA-splicing factor [Serendipita sp. 399]|nr:RNA-splicing factor [Serendipita sp. 399]
MGGGDLNMKKSWHPLLLKNQERVWLEEKKALEEKKKLDQLRKEREEERQVQELQRLQEEKTGKKRVDKLDWLYATPASGSGPNASDMEDYLLGKKRVDKILIADENAKLGATHKNFIAVQNANTARDVAAKVREDPLFAIMQQQQNVMESLRDNPLRLKELQARTGINLKEKGKKDKDKKGKRRHHEDDDYEHKRRADLRPLTNGIHVQTVVRLVAHPEIPVAGADHLLDTHAGHAAHLLTPPDDVLQTTATATPIGTHLTIEIDDIIHRRIIILVHTLLRLMIGYDESERAARLAAMSKDADQMETERAEHLAVLEAKDSALLQAEEEARKRNARDGVMGSFLSNQQKQAMDVSLGDRMRQGHRGLISQRGQ